MRFVTIEQAVANAMIALGLEQDEYRNIFTDWAYEATRSIGVTNVNIETDIINIVGGLAPIPSNLIAPSQIAVKKSGTEEYAYPLFNSNYWSSIPQSDQVYRQNRNYYINIQGSNFVFSTDVTSDGFNQLVLEFYAMPINENGEPMIPEYYLRAVGAYIEFMYTKRLRHRKRNEVPMSEVGYLEDRWIRMKTDTVVQRNTPSRPELENALRQWNTMLPNQRRMNPRPQIIERNI